MLLRRQSGLAGSGLATLVALAAFALFSPVPLWAEAEGASAGKSDLRHDVALFVGVTEEHDEAFTLGLEYEYRIAQWFGAGALVDYAFGDERKRLGAAAAFFHPVDRLKLILAPGAERTEGTEGSGGSSKFAVRVGVAYEFELTERLYLAPAVDVDFVDREGTWVWGVNVGFKPG